MANVTDPDGWLWPVLLGSRLPAGTIQPGATDAAGVTQEHPLRRQIARLAGVAPGLFPTPLCVPGVARGCAVGPMNPGVLRAGGCDPGCDQAVIGRLLAITLSRGIFPAGSPDSCRRGHPGCRDPPRRSRPAFLVAPAGRFRGSSRLPNAPLWPVGWSAGGRSAWVGCAGRGGLVRAVDLPRRCSATSGGTRRLMGVEDRASLPAGPQEIPARSGAAVTRRAVA